jgi:quinolinate synthase
MKIDVSKIGELGFVDAKISDDTNLIHEINRLRKEKNAIILAHYYQRSEIQEIADFVGDSLALSQIASNVQAKIILFAGVKFMAETAKILSPNSKVLLPDLNAGCSLADSCKYVDFKNFISNFPNHTVVTYVNTSADIKVLSDICCTSSNALKVINSIPKSKGIIFAPDENLGNYIKTKLNRKNIVVWKGACHVHEKFSLEKIIELKNNNKDAKLIVHPECKKSIQIIADYIGSTSDLLNFVRNDNCKIFIVATEPGILFQMKKENPKKIFIPAPSIDSSCGCSECLYMKLITLEKIFLTLNYEIPEIIMENNFINKAKKPILNMLKIV